MSNTNEDSDIAVTFRTDGKSVRLTGLAKWRRAIMLRDLRRTTLVGLEIDGLNQGELVADQVDVLKPLFDEIDPAPVQSAPEDPPISPESGASPEPADSSATTPIQDQGEAEPAARGAQSPGSSPAWVVAAAAPSPPVPLAVKPVAPVRAVSPAASKPAPEASKASAGAWALVIVAVICLVLAVRSCNSKPHTAAPADQPPYPITAFASPIQETVLAQRINVHEGPGAEYPKLDPLDGGTAITAYGSANAQDGGVWQYIQTPAGQHGYVNARLVGPAH